MTLREAPSPTERTPDDPPPAGRHEPARTATEADGSRAFAPGTPSGRAARLVAHLLGVPAAGVTVADARGLHVTATHADASARGIATSPGVAALAARVVASAAPVFVEEAEGALASGSAGVRFFAGVPLRDAAGACVGALWAADLRPRALSAGERAALEDLAALALPARGAEPAASRAPGDRALRDETPRDEAPHARGLDVHFQALIEHGGDVITLVGQDGLVRYMSPSVTRITGRAPGVLVGRDAFAFIHPGDVAGVRAVFATVVAGARDGEVEFRVSTDAGGWAWLHARATNLLDDPAVGLVAVTSRDVTARRRAERALRESEERYRLLLDAAHDAILVADATTGLLIDANRRAAELVGRPRGEIAGLHHTDIHPPDERERYSDFFATVVSGGSGVVTGHLWHAAAARRVPVEATANAVTLGGRRVVMWILRDGSERERAEQRSSEAARVMEMIARRAALPDVLAAACRLVESGAPGARCTVLLLDASGTRLVHGAAPSLPDAYVRAIDGSEIGPDVGSCGSAAARGETVVSEDLAADPRWAPFRALALEHGLRACWSTPVRARDGRVLGTFAVYYNTPRGPHADERALVELAVRMAEIALDAREAARALADAEALFRGLVEGSLAGIFVIQAARLVYVNPTAARVFGFETAAEMLAVPLLNLIAPEDRDALDGYIRERFEGEGSAQRTFRGVRRDGSPFEVLAYASVGTYRGTPALIGTALDVSKAAASQRALAESREKYRLLAEQSEQLVYDYSTTTGQITWSGHIEPITGYTERAFNALGIDGWEAHLHPDDHEPTMRALALALDAASPFDVRYRFRHRDGAYRHIEDRGVFMAGPDGRPAHMVGIMADVSARAEAEASVRESARRYRALSELTQTFAYAYDVHESGPPTLAWVTDTIADVAGYTAADVIGRPWGILAPSDDPAQTDAHLAALLDPGLGSDTRVDDVRVRTKAGDYRWLRVLAYPERDTLTGRVVRIYGAAQDVTTQKASESELVLAKESAEEMVRLKDTFLANMSHEIRTPLTAILGYTEILKEELEGEHREFVGIIEQGGRRLMETLTSVLDLARLEADGVQVRPTEVDVPALVAETLRLHGATATAKGVALRAHLPEGEAAGLLDRGLLVRILDNLVGNAIKFTDGGAVTLRVHADARALRIDVEDTGVGISAGFLPHVFDEFRQESTGEARTHEGSGLGLAITRRMVALMQGTIGVESTPGAGTRFTVHLPWRAVRLPESDGPGARAEA